jgi:hypothetical protein
VGPRDKEALERAVLLSAPLYLKKNKQRKHKISELEMARCYFIPCGVRLWEVGGNSGFNLGGEQVTGPIL